MGIGQLGSHAVGRKNKAQQKMKLLRLGWGGTSPNGRSQTKEGSGGQSGGREFKNAARIYVRDSREVGIDSHGAREDLIGG